MRGNQLVEMIRPHLEAAYALHIRPFHASLLPMRALAQTIPRNSIVIFIKSASRGLTPKHLEILRKRGAVIGFDSVDTPISEIAFDLFDFQIAASISGRNALQEHLRSIGKHNVPVELLLHHADPRLRSEKLPIHDRFKCGYIGRPENLYIPNDFHEDISLIYVNYPSQFMKAVEDIRSLSFHYAARPEQQISNSHLRAFKPFTKGMIAASCGANVLVQRETDDAAELLGADYPYLVSGAASPGIRDTFQRAKDDFGGKVWLEGIERMRQLNAAVSSETLARRMRDILDRVSNL